MGTAPHCPPPPPHPLPSWSFGSRTWTLDFVLPFLQGGLGPGGESQVWGVLQRRRREGPGVVRALCERTGECKAGEGRGQQPTQCSCGEERGGCKPVERGQRQLGQVRKVSPDRKLYFERSRGCGKTSPQIPFPETSVRALSMHAFIK